MKVNFPISLEIYDMLKISQAIEDFSDVCDIEFSQGEISFVGENKTEIEENYHEFMNYVLSL